MKIRKISSRLLLILATLLSLQKIAPADCTDSPQKIIEIAPTDCRFHDPKKDSGLRKAIDQAYKDRSKKAKTPEEKNKIKEEKKAVLESYFGLIIEAFDLFGERRTFFYATQNAADCQKFERAVKVNRPITKACCDNSLDAPCLLGVKENIYDLPEEYKESIRDKIIIKNE